MSVLVLAGRTGDAPRAVVPARSRAQRAGDQRCRPGRHGGTPGRLDAAPGAGAHQRAGGPGDERVVPVVLSRHVGGTRRGRVAGLPGTGFGEADAEALRAAPAVHVLAGPGAPPAQGAPLGPPRPAPGRRGAARAPLPLGRRPLDDARGNGLVRGRCTMVRTSSTCSPTAPGVRLGPIGSAYLVRSGHSVGGR